MTAFQEWTASKEVSSRVDLLRQKYANHPLVKSISHKIAPDWTDDPAVFIEVLLASKDISTAQVLPVSEEMHLDLLRFVRTDEIGLHSYLKFLN